MNKVGNFFKTAREERGYTIDYMADITKISVENLVAIEDEDFSVFPAESYVRGFLRSYAAALELDTAQAIHLFDQMKLSQVEVPMEEIWGNDERKRQRTRYIIIASIIAFFLLGVGILFSQRTKISEAIAQKKYLEAQQSLEFTYSVGDSPLLVSKNSKGEIKIDTSEIDIAQINFDFNEEVALFDLFTPEGLSINSLSVKQNETVREELFLGNVRYLLTLTSLSSQQVNLSITTIQLSTLGEVISTTEILNETVEAPYVALLTATAANQFFRYQISEEGEILSHTLKKGETLSLTVGDSLTLWVSNKRSLLLNINQERVAWPEEDTSLVGLYQIRWERGESGSSLVLFSLK